ARRRGRAGVARARTRAGPPGGGAGRQPRARRPCLVRRAGRRGARRALVAPPGLVGCVASMRPVNYVVCVPDGCADDPVDELGGQTPLEAATTPVLDALAARGEVGRAAVIPHGLPPGSDVGNMAIFGYDPARFHTGRAPIEAAALGLKLPADRVAYRCNL